MSGNKKSEFKQGCLDAPDHARGMYYDDEIVRRILVPKPEENSLCTVVAAKNEMIMTLEPRTYRGSINECGVKDCKNKVVMFNVDLFLKPEVVFTCYKHGTIWFKSRKINKSETRGVIKLFAVLRHKENDSIMFVNWDKFSVAIEKYLKPPFMELLYRDKTSGNIFYLDTKWCSLIK